MDHRRSPRPSATDLRRPATRAALLAALIALPAAQASALQGSDDCASAESLVGVMSTFFNASNATTGSEGQSGACGYGVDDDVWFWWAPTTPGLVTLSTCDFGNFDTKVRVFRGAGCPSGPEIACSDNHCGARSRVGFYAEAGATYTFQIGAALGAPGGLGLLTLTLESPNSCAAPIGIQGSGLFEFDNANATNDAEGQNEALCNQFGAVGIAHDVWYRWQATSTGIATVSTCGLTTVDTKVAVYAQAGGGGCPTTAALACNDDACNYQSSLDFACVAGAEYLIQLGTYPTSPGGTGAFRIDVEDGACAYDDGATTWSLGLGAGGTTAWLQSYGTLGETAVLSSVSAAYGSAAIPGFGPPNGTPATIAVWEDPNDDGDPSDAVLVRTQSSAVDEVDTDVLNTTNLLPPVPVRGIYFVGVVVTHGPNQRPMPVCPTSTASHRQWLVMHTGSDFDFEDLAANSEGIIDFGAAANESGSLLLRVECERATGHYNFCHSSTTSFSCPDAAGCGPGIPGRGCANSWSSGGAMLAAMGSANVLADSVRLLASGLPPSTSVLFFQGTGPAMAPFGDGVRCTAGTVVRLGTKVASLSGNAALGNGVAGDAPVHQSGLIGTPAWRYYQAWYRNSASFCTPAAFNLTNGLGIEWK